MIATERLLLRGLTAGDLDDLVALDADPQVMAFVTGGVPEFRPSDLPDLMTGGYWAAQERSGDSFVGWFHLLASAPGEVELGYRLRRAVWGRGYATEGSLALIDFAFTGLGADRVVAQTLVVHTASRRVMEKAGMVESRRFHADWPYRIPGDEAGDVEYAITVGATPRPVSTGHGSASSGSGQQAKWMRAPSPGCSMTAEPSSNESEQTAHRRGQVNQPSAAVCGRES